MDCLDSNRVLDLAAGRLSGEAGAAAEGHMDACPRCRRLVALAARAVTPPHPRPSIRAIGADRVEDSVVGITIGNFVVCAEIARGGMGIVYLAQHPEIGRRVAVKVLDGRLSADPELARRFLAEAQILVQIRHANIVEVYDFGRLSDGRLYYVMELLEGQDLGELLDARGPLPVAQALSLLAQVASGLEACHQAGIVHRDLKPKNIIVQPGGRAKLVDFGLVKILGRRTEPTARSQVGAVVGSPVCMAPEQAAGEVDSITPRTDIYALGVVLYWMLAGRPPFVDHAPGRLMAMHINRDPPPLEELAPHVPRVVSDVVRQCLAKRPEDRPLSASAVVEALQVESAAPPTGHGKRRAAWCVGGLGLAAMAAGAALWGGSGFSHSPARPGSAVVASPGREPGRVAAGAMSGLETGLAGPALLSRVPPTSPESERARAAISRGANREARRAGRQQPVAPVVKDQGHAFDAPPRPRAIGEGTMPF